MDATEHRRSLYGKQDFTPMQQLVQWRKSVVKEDLDKKNHLSTKGDIACPKFWPGIERPSKEQCEKRGNYYRDYTDKSDVVSSSSYDPQHYIEYSYNGNLTRDDRNHKVGLNIGEEDGARKVPVCSSTYYGHYLNRSPVATVLKQDTKHRYRHMLGMSCLGGIGLKLDMQLGSDVKSLTG